MKIRHILYTLAFGGAFILSGMANAQSFSQAQVKEIQGIVHSYLVKNPTVLVEASRALQQQQQSAAQKGATQAITKHADKVFNSDGKPVAGNPKGDITLVEFFDYQCPHCKVMGPIIKNLIASNSNLKVIYADWPIFGGNSQYAAQAAVASMQQGKYLPFHAALTEKGYPLTQKVVLAIAKKVGLDTEKLQKDMKDPSVAKVLKDNFVIAKDLKIMGTPAFVIGNTKTQQYKFFDGQTDQDTLQKIIDGVK